MLTVIADFVCASVKCISSVEKSAAVVKLSTLHSNLQFLVLSYQRKLDKITLDSPPLGVWDTKIEMQRGKICDSQKQ